MENSLIIEKTKEYVKEILESDTTGHDYMHTLRVYNMAIYIAKIEGADILTVSLAALLHDIADHKFHGGNSEIGAIKALEWLNNLNVEENVVNNVCKIVRTISFKAGTENSLQDSIEGMVVQDADRLDAIGAIGIARTFAYGGYKNREIYNPNIKPREYANYEEYKKAENHTINHFYEKLLLLKDLMNTSSAKKIALKRHKFMESFLEQFYKEWDCLDLE